MTDDQAKQLMEVQDRVDVLDMQRLTIAKLLEQSVLGQIQLKQDVVTLLNIVIKIEKDLSTAEATIKQQQEAISYLATTVAPYELIGSKS